MNRVVGAVFFLVFSAGMCAAGEETSFARPALAPFVESGELPGAIIVLYNDGAQETCCIGYADVEARRPITMNDLFMQRSQTKGFCGVTVAMLVEEGRLALDDRVARYLPEYKSLPITLRMCLNHTAGFPFDLPNHKLMGGTPHKMPLRSVAACAAANPLLYKPGTDAKYSNTGIDVAAAVVEVVTGMPWEKFLQARVLDPLGMSDTTFWPTDEQLARRIRLYRVRKGQPAVHCPYEEGMPPPYNGPRVFASAGGGLWTTAADQLKFYKMLMNLGVGDNGVRLLKEETVRRLLAVSSRPPDLETKDWTASGYSLGLCAPKVDGEDRWFGHGGSYYTNCSVNWHRKQLKLVVVQILGEPRPWEKALDDCVFEPYFGMKKGDDVARSSSGRVN